MNINLSTSNVHRGSFEMKSPFSNYDKSPVSFSKIQTLQKNNNSSLPKIKQQIQKSYEDPFKEERFIEKDVTYYKIQKLNRNATQRLNSFNGPNKQYYDQHLIQTKSQLQTPRNIFGENKIVKNYYDSQESPMHRVKTYQDEKSSPKFQGYGAYRNFSSQSSQALTPIQDITKNYSSALIQKSNNKIFQQKQFSQINYQNERPSKLGGRKTSQELFEEDCKINKNLSLIQSILVSDHNKPLVYESGAQKFQKYYVGHRVPTYFHK